MPMDLNSELKNRLTRSTHATVSNLRKSATTENALRNSPQNKDTLSIGVEKVKTLPSDDDEEEEGVDPQKNLAKILRSVSKENMHKHQFTVAAPISSHDDTISLVRNLANLSKPPLSDGVAAESVTGTVASTSEGESSGGREISEIIKNSAVARRRKLNDG